MKTAAVVALYLVAIVAANLSVWYFGPEAAVYNAFALIGLDLTCRDVLHDLWRRQLARNMALLIAAGSALSYVVNPGTARIALASCVAFGLAAVADSLAYHGLRGAQWYERVNGSNVVAAAVDSLVFPWIAFGSFLWPIVFGLFTAKVAGGALWALVLGQVRTQRVVVAVPPPMGPAERLRLEAWGQPPSGARSDYP